MEKTLKEKRIDYLHNLRKQYQGKYVHAVKPDYQFLPFIEEKRKREEIKTSGSLCK